jgi:site-specific DNA recombinase
LDGVVWEDLCRILRDPSMITRELDRARGGAWLAQSLQARRKTVTDALNHVRRQQERLLDVYLAEVIEREEFERKRQELVRTQEGLCRQLRQLEAQVQDQVDTASLAEGIEAFCERVQRRLDQLTFAQRRQLVELLIDCVIVSDRTVEIRYVVPTSQKGEGTHEMRNELSSRRLRCETKICRQGGHNAEDRESIRGWTVWIAVTG